MGWAQPGVLNPTRKRRPPPSTLSKRARSKEPGAVLERRAKRAKRDERVFIEFGDGEEVRRRRLRGIERLPVEILQSIFQYVLAGSRGEEDAKAYDLPAATLHLTRSLCSSYIYRSISLPLFLDPDTTPPARLLLSKFFTLDFYQAHLLPKLLSAGIASRSGASSDSEPPVAASHEATETEGRRMLLPPNLLVKSKLPLIFSLLNTRVMTLSTPLNETYNTYLEDLVIAGAASSAVEIYQRGVFPKESLWEVLVEHEISVEIVVSLVRLFPFQLGFDRHGKRWVQLARMGGRGREAVLYLMNERRMVPPSLEVAMMIREDEESGRV